MMNEPTASAITQGTPDVTFVIPMYRTGDGIVSLMDSFRNLPAGDEYEGPRAAVLESRDLEQLVADEADRLRVFSDADVFRPFRRPEGRSQGNHRRSRRGAPSGGCPGSEVLVVG